MTQKSNEIVTIYFEDNDKKVDAIKHASELGLDPSSVKTYPLGKNYVYGVHAECELEFSRRYKKEYVSKRANEDRDILRGQRCDIPGERQYMRKCPESNSCEYCPNRDNKPVSLSIEHSMERYGRDFFGAYDEMSVQRQIELRETIEEAFKLQPKKIKAFILDNYGYSNQEIQEILNISERSVRRYITAATDLIRDIWLRDEEGGDIV